MTEAKNTNNSLVVIMTVRNEGRYLRSTLDCMYRQTVLPSELIIVNDGSTDDTSIIAHEASTLYSWIKVIDRKDRGYRAVGAGVVDAILDGVDHISFDDYDFLSKIDGDVFIGDSYFEGILKKFNQDSQLGIASGSVVQDEGGKSIHRRNMREFAYGPARIWRRECWDDINGLFRSPGWDSLDCYSAMNKGWKTWVFNETDLDIHCLRRIGSSDRSLLHGYIRDGMSSYFRRDHPLYFIGSGIYRMFDRPFIICGVMRILGFFKAAIKNNQRCSDEELVNFLRRWQVNKIYQLSKKKFGLSSRPFF